MSTEIMTFKITKQTSVPIECMSKPWDYFGVKDLAQRFNIKTKDLSKDWDEAIKQVQQVLKEQSDEDVLNVLNNEPLSLTTIKSLLLEDRLNVAQSNYVTYLELDIKVMDKSWGNLPFSNSITDRRTRETLIFRLLAFEAGEECEILKICPSLESMHPDVNDFFNLGMGIYTFMEKLNNNKQEGRAFVLIKNNLLPELPLNVNFSSTAW